MSDEKKIYPEPSGNFAAGEGSRPGKVEEGDDLRHHTKATLKDFLKNLTSKNSYPVNHDSQIDPATKELKSLDSELHIAKDSSVHGERISTQRHEDQKKQPSFLDVNGSSLESREFRNLSDSGQFTDLEDQSSTLRSFFDKTERGPGHDLLRSTVASQPTPAGETEDLKNVPSHNKELYHKTPDDAPEHQRRLSSILVSNNRFTPTGNSPYLHDGAYSYSPGSLGSIHTTLGVHSLNTPAGDLAISDMRKVGLELIARQAGHSIEGDAGPVSVLAGPGFFSNMISKSNMRARHTKIGQKRLGFRPELDHSLNEYVRREEGIDWQQQGEQFVRRITGWDISETEEDRFFSIAEKSYGNGFSHLERFTSNSMAHTTFLLQGLLGTFLSGTIMGIFLELLYGEFEDNRAQGKDPGSLTMGRWTDAPEATLTRYGIPYLKYPVFNSIASGLLALFGLRKKKNLPEEIMSMWLANFITLIAWFALVLLFNIPDFIKAMGKQKGLFVTLVRNAMRDNDKFNAIFSDPGGFIADLLMQIAMAAITGQSKASILLGIVEMFTSISGFKFFMTLAVIGDKCYEGEIGDFSGLHRSLDRLEDNGQTRTYKSRVNNISNALVWRHRSAPSLFYLPGETFGAMEMMGGTPTSAIAAAVKAGDDEGTEQFRRRVVFDTKNNSHRFHPDDVLEMENQLEAEYMPFYFHDLRTNEIISFHAFITDVKDSFSVEYSDSSGYGRIDPVKIYKKTTRSINLSFYIVSTSQEDFDSMWLSVNKLTQLIYPQWSKGRSVSDGKEGFIMPNSQYMTASPLIRLRVGDFIRSNGSRFNLAKLFGIQEPAGALGAVDGTEITFKGGAKAEKYTADKIEPIAESVRGMMNSFSDQANFEINSMTLGSELILKRSTTHGYVAKPEKEGISILGIAITADPPLFQVWTRCDAVVTVKKVEKRPGASKSMTEEMDETLLSSQVWQVEVEFKDPDDPANPFSDFDDNKQPFKLYVQPSDLKPIMSPANVEDFEAGDATFDAAVEAAKIADLPDFLSADKDKGNPIFKAARSTRGRGLAGFITSLDFDYAEATYETDSLTRRAPKMIKVSINFAPIHDIAPGMDNQGGMRAPLYPVGDIMSQLSQDPLRSMQDYGFKNDPAKANNYGAKFEPKVLTDEVTDPEVNFRKAKAAVSKKQQD